MCLCVCECSGTCACVPVCVHVRVCAQACEHKCVHACKVGYLGYKDGLQPETLADGNWLVKQNQPVSKFETKSDTSAYMHAS